MTGATSGGGFGIDKFDCELRTARILFGAGRLAELPAEVRRLGARRALVVTTAGHGRRLGERALEILGPLSAALHAGAEMHTPVEATERAFAVLRAERCDALIAVGGGSAIGLAKALALRSGLSQIAVPTTYAGSEVTSILGETANGAKTTQRSPALLPAVVIYDVELSLALPRAYSLCSGLNAVAHAAEALYARDANPVVAMLAEQGLAALARALPALAERPGDPSARADALYGAWLCGTCLGSVAMGLHHQLCHVLGGRFGLPHAETHALMLPYALAYNAVAAPEAMRRIGRALDDATGTADAPWATLRDWHRHWGLTVSLRELGMPASGIDAAVAAVRDRPYANPRPIEAEPLRRLLRNAWDGAAPTFEEMADG